MVLGTSKQGKPLFRGIASVVLMAFIGSMVITPRSFAANTVLNLPAPGTMVQLSPAFKPFMMHGLSLHPENPLMIDFIVSRGESQLNGDAFKDETTKLIKYFLATLAIPDGDVWVNLSPYEKDRIVSESLGQTELGRDMLAQDYILKQMTASLIYPEKGLGKKFWDKVYAQAQAQFGTTEIPVNTFNKVWIVADQAKVHENNKTVFVIKSHLKVMLEEDYLATVKNNSLPARGHIPGAEGVGYVSPSTLPSAQALNAKATQGANATTAQIIRQIIIPALETEVNTGKNFANLRQIYNSMILAVWFKTHLKTALLNQVYTDRQKLGGVDVADKSIKQKIYEQYLQAYKKGVFNYIKEESSLLSPKGSAGVSGSVIASAAKQSGSIPRKYFSGGLTPVDPALIAKASNAEVRDFAMSQADDPLVIARTVTPVNDDSAMQAQADFDHSDLLRATGGTVKFELIQVEVVRIFEIVQQIRKFLEARPYTEKNGIPYMTPLFSTDMEKGGDIHKFILDRLSRITQTKVANVDNFFGLTLENRGKDVTETELASLKSLVMDYLYATEFRMFKAKNGTDETALQNEYSASTEKTRGLSYSDWLKGKVEEYRKAVKDQAMLTAGVRPSAEMEKLLVDKLEALRSRLMPLISAYNSAKQSGNVKDVAEVEASINKIVDESNVFQGVEASNLEAAPVESLKSFKLQESYTNYRKRAIDSFIKARYIPQFIYAGAATRLKRGPMYPLDIWDIAIELGLAKAEDAKFRLGMGPRQIIAYRTALRKIGKKQGLSGDQLAEMLRNQKMIININAEIEELVLADFRKNNFYGFNPDNIFFIVQPTYKGYQLNDQDVSFDPNSAGVPYGHGDNFSQLGKSEQAFRLSINGEKSYLKDSVLENFSKDAVIASHRINDLTKLTSSTVVDVDKVAFGLYSFDQGSNVVVELVNNPNKQKGGNALKNKLTGKSMLMETSNTKGSKELTGLLDEIGKTGAPYNAFRLLYNVESLKGLLRTSLSYNLRFKEGVFYLEAVTGDVTQLPEANAQFFNADEDIHDFKEPKNTQDAIKFLKEQDREIALDSSDSQVQTTSLSKTQVQMPVHDYRMGKGPLQRGVIKTKYSAEKVLNTLSKAKEQNIILRIIGYLRGIDGAGSSLDLPAFQRLLTPEGGKLTGFEQLPSTVTLTSDQKTEITFELNDDPDAISYEAPDYLGGGKVYTVKGEVALTGQGRTPKKQLDAPAYIFRNIFGLRGIKINLKGISPIALAGGMESSNAFNVALITAASVLSGANLSYADIVALAVKIENDELGGLTGGQGHWATILGGAHQLVWLSGIQGNNYGAATRELLSTEQVENISKHVYIVQPGKVYENGKAKTDRTAALVNFMWTDGLLHDPFSQELHARKVPLAARYAQALAEGDFKTVVSVLNEYADIRDQIARRWMNLMLDAKQGKEVPEYAQEYLRKVFDPVGDEVEDYKVVRELYEDLVVRLDREDVFRQMSFYSTDDIKEVVAKVESQTASFDINDTFRTRLRKAGGALFDAGAGGPGSNKIVVFPGGQKQAEAFFAQESIGRLTDDEARKIIRGTGVLRMYMPFQVGKSIVIEGFDQLTDDSGVNLQTPQLPSKRTVGLADVKKPVADAALVAYGGIDLNDINKKLQSEGQGVNIQFNPTQLEQFKRGDFTGVQIKIMEFIPMPSLRPLLGLKEEDERLAKV